MRELSWGDAHPSVLKGELIQAEIDFEDARFDESKTIAERVLNAHWNDQSTPHATIAHAALLWIYAIEALDDQRDAEEVVNRALPVLHAPAVRRIDAAGRKLAEFRTSPAHRGGFRESVAWLSEPATVDQP
jgi:hypothetical protein